MKTPHAIKKANGIRRRDIHWTRKPLAPGVLTGKQMAVIGGTNGIGRALARTFAALVGSRRDGGGTEGKKERHYACRTSGVWPDR